MVHEMRDCESIRPLLGEYLRRRLPADVLADIRHHLAECPECAAAFEEERVFSTLAGSTDEPAPVFLLAGVMERVRAEPCPLPAFRVRPLDVIFALSGTIALVGVIFGFMSLSIIVPAVEGAFADDMFLNRAFVADVAAVLTWSVLGLAVVALATAGTRRLLTRRPPLMD